MPSKFAEGAKQAWKTRQLRGWKRPTIADKKAKLLQQAHQKLSGYPLKLAEKHLTKRYRSKATERDVVEKYARKLEKIK